MILLLLLFHWFNISKMTSTEVMIGSVKPHDNPLHQRQTQLLTSCCTKVEHLAVVSNMKHH